ncbi:MAG: hypothetical protein JNL01_15320 [Bdellovibrionales bacterium]|nr:hypothetical protein [Bdellovibrionales bacterium]
MKKKTAAKPTESPNSKEAIQMLIEGNERFAAGVRSVEAFASSLRLKDLAEQGQKPFAAILTCSDSRAPIETLFDRGLGDLFVSRVAGNTLSDIFMAGIEYSVHYFQVPLVVVMGHTMCGAIAATFDKMITPEMALPSPNLESLVIRLLPENMKMREKMAKTFKQKKDAAKKALLLELNWNNIRQNVSRIQTQSPIVAERIREGRLQVVGALYDIESGRVVFDLPAKSAKAKKAA